MYAGWLGFPDRSRLNRTRPPPGSELVGSAYDGELVVEVATDDDVSSAGVEDVFEPHPVATETTTTRNSAGVRGLAPAATIHPAAIMVASITQPNQRYNTPLQNSWPTSSRADEAEQRAGGALGGSLRWDSVEMAQVDIRECQSEAEEQVSLDLQNAVWPQPR